MTTSEFIQQYRNDDVRQLAFLASKYPEVDAVFALDQIRGWQIAQTKLPRWAAVDDLQYPPHLSMEQCSSEPTADYKAAVARRLASESLRTNENALFVDITGGFGVDFSYIALALDIKAVYVERNEVLCNLARHNFPLLGLDKAEVVCGDGEEYAKKLEKATMVYIDPARRDEHGARTYGIEDCTPNILELLPMLMQKTDYVVVKLSPMLDWHSAVASVDGCLDGGSCVTEVHIVSLANECKELLMVVAHGKQKLKVVCVNGNQQFAYCPDEDVASVSYSDSEADAIVGNYLFEPNASIMKAGCFQALAAKYGVSGVGRNSHLFVSKTDVAEFPGRRFVVEAMSTMNMKELKRTLANITKANITTRNFPLSVAELRKRLKLKDGGDVYLFATTLADDSHVILVCKKAN